MSSMWLKRAESLNQVPTRSCSNNAVSMRPYIQPNSLSWRKQPNLSRSREFSVAAGLHRPPQVCIQRMTGIQEKVTECEQHPSHFLAAGNALFARAARLRSQSRASGFSQQLAATLQCAIVQ